MMKCAAVSLLAIFAAPADEVSSIPAMESAVKAFVAGLDDGQRAKAVFSIDAEDRENFRFTPRERTGLALKEMNEAQNAAAMKLLESALSEKGKLKAMQIITLEGVLRELEKNPDYRDPGKYYVSVFGTPGDGAVWGWKFEGHHLSLNYAVVGEKVSVTPSFFAANPAEVRQGEHQGLRVLAAEEDLAMALANVLLEGGKKEVVFSERPPGEILTAENRTATALEPVGLPAAEMTPAEQAALRELISEYVGRHRKDLADADWKKIDDAGFGKVRFGWAGGTKRGEAWYYRVQGPTFLMEAANTQNNANHIHATWRSFEGDFGRDLISEHYHQHEKDGGDH